MIKITLDGRPLRAGDLEKSLIEAAVNSAKAQLHERFSAIRHPDTGEFPTVVVVGDRLDDLRMIIEGSPRLLEIVKDRMAEQDRERVTFVPTEQAASPKVFLSYAFEDRDSAARVANALIASGIDTWWAEWEMRAGDSLRQRIDSGLNECTHFIVLLTPASVQKPWVNQEMDAGLVLRISGKARFIALREQLPAANLPPLLSGMLSPEIGSDFELSMRTLIHDILGLSKKPTLGPAPPAATLPATGYSKIATVVAAYFVAASQNAEFADPQKAIAELESELGLSRDEINDALHELRDFVKVGFDRVLPKSELYATFDKYFKAWSPEDDALRIAADLVNNPEMSASPSEIAAQYDWPARRLNAALAYLISRKLIHERKVLGSSPWITIHVGKTDATRRFVQSRG